MSGINDTILQSLVIKVSRLNDMYMSKIEINDNLDYEFAHGTINSA